MAAQRKRRARVAPGTLPVSLSLPRVLRALNSLGISADQFREAYRDAAAPRGRGVAEPSARVLAAYKDFLKNSDFEAFVRAGGFRDRSKATNELGRCARYLAQQGRRQG